MLHEYVGLFFLVYIFTNIN